MGIRVRRIHFGLMLGLALATVACLESVGVILVVAMLVFPSVTASFFFVRLSSLLWASFPLGVAVFHRRLSFGAMAGLFACRSHGDFRWHCFHPMLPIGAARWNHLEAPKRYE